MRYIVYSGQHTSYGIEQGGYYVSYKDKLSDNYSDSPIDAKKYKTLGGAITRLGLGVGKIDSVDKYIKRRINTENKNIQRIMKIKSISDKELTLKDVIRLRDSRIEKMDDKGNVSNCDDEIVIYVTCQIRKNKEKNEKIIKQLDYDPHYTSQEPADSSFWDEWISE